MYIKVRVVAGAKKEVVKKISKTSYAFSVKEPTELNRANKRVIELLAQELGVTKNKVHIINGHQSPSKMFSVDVEKE